MPGSALAAHSAEDASEQSANLTFSILPKADGTGWRASLAWRRGASDARLATLGGISSWTAPSGRLPGTELHWIAESRLGYGIRLPRGLATPFMELDAGHSGRGGARFGVRHEFGERARGLVVEWGIEPSSFANAGNRILLEALGRFWTEDEIGACSQRASHALKRSFTSSAPSLRDPWSLTSLRREPTILAVSLILS